MGQNKTRTSGNFIMQAGILAFAGIIVKIIGLLYRSPLTAIIGDEGNGYYSFAYNIYANILLISSYSIPSAISKIMSQKLALKEYRNAYRIYKCAFVYVAVVGGIAAGFAYFAAGLLVVDNAVPVLRIFAPTIFLSGFLGVFRGFFQSRKSMIPTSLSQILEQIMNAGISIGAAVLFIRLAGNGVDETTKAIKGASGSALGTGSGVLFALIFVGSIYFANRKHLMEHVYQDKSSNVDSYFGIAKDILFVVTPFILSTFIYNCSTAINQTFYAKIMLRQHGLTQSAISTYYGIYSGKAVVLRNVPVALASAMSSAIIPTIAEAWVLRNKKDARSKVEKAIRVTMLVAIPCVAGFVFLAKPIVNLLFPQKASLDLASAVLMGLSITVVFYCVSTITNGVLQSIGQVNKPVTHASIALVVQTIVLILLLRFTGLNLWALVIVDVLYSLLMCLLNGYALKKHMNYSQEWVSTFIMPAICSLAMGLVAKMVYTGMYAWTKSNPISLLACIIFGAVVYFVFVLQTRTVDETDLLAMPKGATIIKIVKRLHLVSDDPKFKISHSLKQGYREYRAANRNIQKKHGKKK